MLSIQLPCRLNVALVDQRQEFGVREIDVASPGLVEGRHRLGILFPTPGLVPLLGHARDLVLELREQFLPAFFRSDRVLEKASPSGVVVAQDEGDALEILDVRRRRVDLRAEALGRDGANRGHGDRGSGGDRDNRANLYGDGRSYGDGEHGNLTGQWESITRLVGSTSATHIQG